MTLATALLAGRYVLEERIGVGGYCEVWRATDTVLTRPVAVKLLHAGYAQQGEALARFKAEARHAGALSHQNIARVYDYDEPVDGQSYLVMELVEGPSLADVLASGPLSAGRTMDVVAQVAAGLQAAHSAGLIHRDVKPANILFAPGGAVRITDFGIAHAVGSAPVTSTGMVMGTPGYIAPERVSGAQAGPASDLYALGVVAYECLAGSQPFSGAALDVAIAHRDRPLPPLPTSVPAEVVAFVMILTAKDPAWRPGSAAEVAYQAGRLRDDLVGARAAGAPLTVLDAAQSRALVGVSSRPRASRPRYGRAVAVAALALAALTCLVLISVTGFAPR
jgi:serine/threonine protein kinase